MKTLKIKASALCNNDLQGLAKKVINGISFTTGIAEKLGEYYNITLFKRDKQVYKATMTGPDAADVINKFYPKIKIK